MLIHFVVRELNGIVYLCGIFAKWELSRVLSQRASSSGPISPWFKCLRIQLTSE